MQPNNSSNNNPIRPQNISCPAGGTYSAKSEPTDSDCSQRGVIVAPPSGNTSGPPNLTVLHKGFDTLALAVEANIGPEFFEYLEVEKERAEKEGRDILIDYHGLRMHLKSHGGNGYRFILNGGPDGATWFFKKPNAKDAWGIRLSFGSYFMAMHGIHAAKSHCEYVLDTLGIRYDASRFSISRVDFCVDILTDGFSLNPDNFVMHSSTGRRDFVTGEDKSVNGKSGRTTSVTIGQSRNRQVIIYDKTSEIITKRKEHWWNIWSDYLHINSVNFVKKHNISSNFSTVDKPNFINKAHDLSDYVRNYHNLRVWRIEFRAGKDLLKDRWGIRTWEQLFTQFGDLCRETGEVVRYTKPSSNDPNRARWPNHTLWDVACGEINHDLMDMRSGADPNPMKEVHKEQHISLLFRNLLGSSITLAALKGKKLEDLPQSFEKLAKEMSEAVRCKPNKSEKQLQKANERYHFITNPLCMKQ
jgi:hypothetical protein